MVEYIGDITSVTPLRPSYAVGEEVRLNVKYKVTRIGGDPNWVWHSRIVIEDAFGGQLVNDPTYHAGNTDVATKDLTWSLGQQPASGISGKVKLYAGGA